MVLHLHDLEKLSSPHSFPRSILQLTCKLFAIKNDNRAWIFIVFCIANEIINSEVHVSTDVVLADAESSEEILVACSSFNSLISV